MQSKIIIFNEKLQLVGALGFNGSELSLNKYREYDASAFLKILNDINEQLPTVYKEEENEESKTRSLYEVSISKDDPKYLDAVVSVLRKNNITAALVPQNMVSLFHQLSDELISYEQRKEFMGDLINMNQQDAQLLEQVIIKIRPLLKEIENNRNNWSDFLKNKKEEVLSKKNSN